MNMKIYKVKIGTRKFRRIKGWDVLDAAIRYLKLLKLWSKYNDKRNQQFLNALKIQGKE